MVAWLYGATTHHCLNRLRDQRNRARLVRDATRDSPPSGASEHRVALTQALARMPDELARVVVYHALDELTQDEIAELMSCSRRHVGNLIARARSWLRAQEEDHGSSRTVAP